MRGRHLLRLATVLLLAYLAAAVVANPFPGSDVDQELLDLLKTTVASASSFEDRYDAEVWLLANSTKLERFVPDKPERLDLLRKIHREASRAGLSPEIVLSVIEVESRFDRYAVSTAGAQGL